jgi:hypothetical protein
MLGYQAGYMNALDLKDHQKCIIFGMEAREILDILSKHVKIDWSIMLEGIRKCHLKNV